MLTTTKNQSKDICKKCRQIIKFNASFYSASTHQKTVSSYFNITKSTAWHRCKNSSRILYIGALCAPHQVFRCGWARIAPSSHRKWDTQHLEIKEETLCYVRYRWKHTVRSHPPSEHPDLTKILFHSPEVRRTVPSGGKPSCTLRSSWGKTKERMRPRSPQLQFQMITLSQGWTRFPRTKHIEVFYQDLPLSSKTTKRASATAR